MPQRIDFAAFGDRFIRFILHPGRLAAQFAAKLPPPVHGTANIALNGAVAVEYTASVRPPRVDPTTTTGTHRVTLAIDMALTGRILGGITTKTYRFVGQVPFWMTVDPRPPLALFFNTYPVVESEIVVTPNGESPPGAIYDQVVTEVRRMLRVEVDKALAGTAAARLVDLMPKPVAAFAASETTGEPGAFRDDTSWESGEALGGDPAGGTPPAVATDVLPDETGTFAAQAGKYDVFGAAFIWYRVNARVLAGKLNEAIAKNPIQPQSFSEGIAWGNAHAYPGKVTVKNLGQNTAHDEQGLEVRLPVDLTIKVCIAGVWNEAWAVKAVIPILMPVRTWEPGPIIYLAYRKIDPASIGIGSTQLTGTGLAWGAVEGKLRTKLVEELHKTLDASNAERSVSLEREVRRELGEK